MQDLRIHCKHPRIQFEAACIPSDPLAFDAPDLISSVGAFTANARRLTPNAEAVTPKASHLTAKAGASERVLERRSGA